MCCLYKQLSAFLIFESVKIFIFGTKSSICTNMDSLSIKIILSGVLFTIIIISGFRLRKTGHPYNFIMVSVHKFSSLAIFVILIFIIFQLKDIYAVPGLAFNLIILSGILFVLALVSGGLLSAGKISKKIISLTHKITPFLILISCGLALFLIIN